MERIKNGWATGMEEGQRSCAACSYRYPFGSLALSFSALAFKSQLCGFRVSSHSPHPLSSHMP